MDRGSKLARGVEYAELLQTDLEIIGGQFFPPGGKPGVPDSVACRQTPRRINGQQPADQVLNHRKCESRPTKGVKHSGGTSSDYRKSLDNNMLSSMILSKKQWYNFTYQVNNIKLY